MTNKTQTIEKAFFEVEGIKGVFEGVHMGEMFSYGRVPYFDMKTCLDIIKHTHNPFNVFYAFDDSKKTFVETWIEDGENMSHEVEKLEVFGTTYYQLGNGWSWEFSYEEKATLYAMPTKRLEEKLSWLGSFYDIYQKSQEIDDSAIDNLSQIYIDYCNEWGLPQLSCDELICEILSILND
jgi:hypothetical protein